MPLDKNLERIYIQLANLIYDLNFRYRISEEEKVFLLNLLEIIIYNKDKPQLLGVLKLWMDNYNASELDQIIKATLLATDWTDGEAEAFNIQVIIDLLDAKEDIGDAEHETGGEEFE